VPASRAHRQLADVNLPLLPRGSTTSAFRSHAQDARGCGICQSGLDRANVLRFFALLAGSHVELDMLTLFEALIAIALDVGEMHEDVITLLTRDEAESLFCIEELHCSLCHKYSILKMTKQPMHSVADNPTPCR